MKTKKIESVINIIFIILAFVIITLITLGVNYDLTKISNWTFWVETFGKLALTLIVYNYTFSVIKSSKENIRASRFFQAFATNVLKIKKLEEEKLYKELDIAVEEENQERLIKYINVKLHRFCTRLNYNDVFEYQDDFDGLVKHFMVAPKRVKRLKKLFDKILQSNVRIHEINSDLFLRDKELAKFNTNEYDYNVLAYKGKNNVGKGLTFLVCSVLTVILSFNPSYPNLLTALLTNSTLIVGASVSGLTFANKTIKRNTAMYEMRNRFLSRRLNIDVEYVAPVETESVKKVS